MNGNNAVDRKFARLLAPLAILFVSVFQCGAQSQDQAGTDQKTTGKDGIIACRFSVLDGRRRKVHVEARTNDGRKLQVGFRLKPDPINELNFKVGVYPQGYSIQELPRKK